MTVDRLPFIPAWLDDADLSPQEVRILIHILRRGECYESIISIARHCRISHHTVRSSIKILRAKGFIKEVERRGQTTIYTSDITGQPLLKEEGPPTISGRGSAPTPTKIGRGPLLNEEGDPYQNRKTKVSPNKVTPLKEKKPSSAPDILTYLNEKAGKHFRSVDAHLRHIDARLSETGVTIDGIREMIDDKVASWKGDEKMDQYLRPQTLFSPTNFAGYYDNRVAQSPAAKITYFEPANQPPGHELKKA